jgi:hypothetical protein
MGGVHFEVYNRKNLKSTLKLGQVGEGEGNEDGQMHRLKAAVGELEEEA